MSERIACVLAALYELEQPYPAFAALVQAIADAAIASPAYAHVYVYALDVPRDATLTQQTELPVPMSFMMTDLRDLCHAMDGDVVLTDILRAPDGQKWCEYRVNTDMFIR